MSATDIVNVVETNESKTPTKPKIKPFMIQRLQDTFALSETGAKDLRTSIVLHALLNLCLMLPVTLAFIFLQQYLPLLGHETLANTSQSSIVANLTSQYGLWFYLGFAVCSFVIMYAIAYVDYTKTYTKTYEESASIRIKLAETLRALPMAFFGKKDVADLSAIIMEDVTQIEHLFSHAVPQIFASAISMAIISVMMFTYNWQMSLAMFWVVPVGFFVFYLSKKRMEQGHQQIYNDKRVISEQIQNGIDMVQEVKAYNQEERYLQALEETLDNYEKSLIQNELLDGALINLSYFVLKLGLPSVIFAGAYLFVHDGISLFTYLVFLIVVGRIYDPFMDAMNNFAALLYLKVRIERMREMDTMPRQTGRKEFHPEHFDIEFKNVDFSYHEGGKTLEGVSFIAKQGEITALIGPSGGGKSTAAKLAARFWDVDDGEILVGGTNIKEIDPEALLSHFAIVFQDVALFNSSVLNNIRLGRKDATDDEVKAVAKLTECHDFIERLPNGYDTLIGENGERLSGGERQRISIARAVLKDAPVVLLDEATASLDARNERKIQQAIGTLIKDKTVLIIAHRMRTVINADKIVALKEGLVAEFGSPDTLIEENGVFARMVRE